MRTATGEGTTFLTLNIDAASRRFGEPADPMICGMSTKVVHKRTHSYGHRGAESFASGTFEFGLALVNFMRY